VRQEERREHFDLTASQRAIMVETKSPETVVTETCGLVPRRAVVSAGDVRDVMFEVMLLETERLGIDFQSLGKQRTQIAQGFPCAGAAG